jgi:hypothetical protein
MNKGRSTFTVPQFLGAFEKVRKAKVSFAMNARPSVCPVGTIRLPLDGFSVNLIFEYYGEENAWKIQV